MNETVSASLPEYKTVCGGKLKDPSTYPSAVYHGEQVFFCTRACLRVFEQNPDGFISGDVKHPQEDKD